MKILQHLQQAKINDVAFIRLAGSIFVALGLLLLSSGKLTTLTCNRSQSNQGSCQLISSGLLGSHVQETRVSELQGASVEDNPLDNDAFRVILLTKSGRAFFSSSSSGNEMEAKTTASDINTFIQDTKQTTLTIEQDERGFYFPIGGSVIAAGLLTLVFSKASHQQPRSLKHNQPQ